MYSNGIKYKINLEINSSFSVRFGFTKFYIYTVPLGFVSQVRHDRPCDISYIFVLCFVDSIKRNRGWKLQLFKSEQVKK